jgi:hypothetical protein
MDGMNKLLFLLLLLLLLLLHGVMTVTFSVINPPFPLMSQISSSYGSTIQCSFRYSNGTDLLYMFHSFIIVVLYLFT